MTIMTGPRLRDSSLMLLVLILLFSGSRASAQNAEQLGLPPVVENYGLENPPDLPGATSSTNPPATMANPPTSLNNSGAISPEPSSNGGILNTLDNLPPVGNTGRNTVSAKPAASGQPNFARMPNALQNPASRTPNAIQSSAANNIAGQPGGIPEPSAPRVVRFGDVRSESEALKQYPDLRRESRNAPNRGTTEQPRSTAPPSRAPQSGPFKFLDRFIPWKKTTAEPPLTNMGVDSPEDTAVDATRPGTGSAVLNRASLADKTDSEIQKRVDRIARQQLGNRTSTMDVEVIDREVYIKAKPVWFWQRRQVSDELRKLPGVDPKRLHVTVY